MFRVFKYRNFRLFFPGLIISQIGIWVQNVAISWLVYEVTKSAFITGFTTFISTLPLFFFTPVAGVLIDKFNKHKFLLTLQILFLLQALMISLLFYTDTIRLPNIILSGLFLNTLVSIDGPLRQSLFINLVDNKKDLTNAISINSSCFNVVKLIGPAMSGLIIANFGVGICFIINFIFILPNIILVSLMKIEDNIDKIKKPFLKDFKDGIKYVVNTPKIYYLQLFLALFCFIIMIYPMLMPIFTKDVYNANADILGYLMASIGFGALVSSLLIASKKDNKNLKIIMIGACLALGINLILFGVIKNVYFSLFIAFLIGLCITGFITPQISLLQSVINDSLRGRVMSYNTMAILGMASLGTVFSGTVTQYIGILNTFILYGIILITLAILFYNKLKNVNY